MSPFLYRSHGRKRDLQPAPGRLLLLQVFLNTADLRAGTEVLRSPAALAQWAVGEGLLPTHQTLTEEDLQRVLGFREGLRAVLARSSLVPSQLSSPQLVTSQALLRARFEPGGEFRLEPAAGGIDGVLGRLLVCIAAAQEEGVWRRFKVCSSADCRTAFYDRSPNRSTKWCRPRCGNRLSARAMRRGQ